MPPHVSRLTPYDQQTSATPIPWTFQRENTALGRKIKTEPTGIDYLKMLSVSRLFMDNIDNIQSSWLTQGLRLGQVALLGRGHFVFHRIAAMELGLKAKEERCRQPDG